MSEGIRREARTHAERDAARHLATREGMVLDAARELASNPTSEAARERLLERALQLRDKSR